MSSTINNPKTIKAWTFYDWANSVYSLVITATIFPIYYAALTHTNNSQKINLVNRSFEPDSLFSYSLTISFFIVVLTTPILSSIADVTGTKKKFLKFFCYLGGLSCIGLYFFTDKSQIVYGLVLNITASIGFWGSLVFYNSYLPDIATEDRQDQISAKGYIMGYWGSIILLITCLLLIEIIATPENKLLYTRLCFVLTGIWWMAFAQYTFANLPDSLVKDKNVKKRKLIFSSFRTLKNVQKELFQDRSVKYFLLSFFFYSVGIQTIFLTATLFGTNEIKLDTSKLMVSILLIQFVAIIGAYSFSILSKRIGNKLVIIICILVWIGICLLGFFLDKTNPYVEYYFYVVAGLVGLVMGGIQSMSRSTYSKMLPKKDQNITTTYFSFYDVLEKCAIILGSFTYGYLIDKTGNMRYSILAMSVAFVIGLFFMFGVDSKKINK